MSRVRRRVLGVARAALAGLATFAVSGTAWAAGGPPATQLINVADTRGLETGPGLWSAQIYNESFLLYGVVVVAAMVAQGLVLGFGFDRAMHMLGLDLGKLEHHE
jgi:hypothetical protein